jgi:oligoribonuclease
VTVRADDDQLVWLDLEMTGLDVERETIVEIACIVTDSQLNLLDDGIDIVVHQDADSLARMDDFVRRMHTKSGLLPLIGTSEVSVAEAERRTLEYVRKHVSTPRTAP